MLALRGLFLIMYSYGVCLVGLRPGRSEYEKIERRTS
jgi:hypothetical protein